MGSLHINLDVPLEVMNSTGSTQIGTLNVGEAFAYQVDYATYRWIIVFRNSSGQKATGYLDTAGVTGISSWYNHPISKVTLKDYETGTNKEHYVYNVRRTSTIYKPDGMALTTKISAGGAVAVPAGEAGESGSSHPDWMLVRYIKTDSSASWTPVYNLAPPYNNLYYGFVPIGLEYGSGENMLSVYGSW